MWRTILTPAVSEGAASYAKELAYAGRVKNIHDHFRGVGKMVGGGGWALMLGALLSACSTTSVSGCPPLVAYPPAAQSRAAAELRALPKGSPLAVMIVDYGKTRDACRATK